MRAEWQLSWIVSLYLQPGDRTKNLLTCRHHSGCDSDKNPLNWKRGGSFGADQIQYQITTQIDQGYTPGTCSFHLQEDESWSGVDGPGTKRHWTYHIEKDTMKDNAGNTIGTDGFASDGTDGSPEKAGDGDPLKWSTKIPDPLVLTPEPGGNPRDYIQFTVGSQSWTTDNQTGMPYCNVGGWSSNYSPAVSPSLIFLFPQDVN